MPYVKRDANGSILSIAVESDNEHEEYLASTSQDIIDFLDIDASQTKTLQALKDSDQELARALEDLIQLLINKQVILFTDLPDPVQQKLVSRQKLRSLLNQQISSILSEDDTL